MPILASLCANVYYMLPIVDLKNKRKQKANENRHDKYIQNLLTTLVHTDVDIECYTLTVHVKEISL